MKLYYDPDTDTLSITISDKPGADAEEVAPGVVVDVDAEGRLLGIELDPAGSVTDPSILETNLKVHPLKLKATA